MFYGCILCVYCIGAFLAVKDYIGRSNKCTKNKIQKRDFNTRKFLESKTRKKGLQNITIACARKSTALKNNPNRGLLLTAQDRSKNVKQESDETSQDHKVSIKSARGYILIKKVDNDNFRCNFSVIHMHFRRPFRRVSKWYSMHKFRWIAEFFPFAFLKMSKGNFCFLCNYPKESRQKSEEFGFLSPGQFLLK